MRFFLLLLIIYGCNSKFILECDSDNYYISTNPSHNTSFKKQNREVVTTFSEIEMTSHFNETNISCKEVLGYFFHCNICFNNDTNYLQSYNGKFYKLNKVKDPNIFTNNVINLISSMQMGQEEYKYFLNHQKSHFSTEEKKLLKTKLKNPTSNEIIFSKKIQTH